MSVRGNGHVNWTIPPKPARAARLLHISDWHLGKGVQGFSRDEDHQAAVEEQIEVARTAEVDIIIHTGDLFDAISPAQAVLHNACRKLRELSEIAPTYIIGGNHDSQPLFFYLDEFVGRSGQLRFIHEPKKITKRLEVAGDEAPARVHLIALPFVRPTSRLPRPGDERRGGEAEEGEVTLSEMMSAASPTTAASDYRGFLRDTQLGLERRVDTDFDPARDVRVIGAHLMLEGALLSGTERRLHITEAFQSPATDLPRCEYAALGHIHRPQELPAAAAAGAGAYCGSPMQMDFGERDENKRCLVVDLYCGAPPMVHSVPLSAARALERVKGSLEELGQAAASMAATGRPAMLSITAHTDQPEPNLSDRITQIFEGAPENTVIVEMREVCAATSGAAVQALTAADATVTPGGLQELFSRYLVERSDDAEATGQPAFRSSPEDLLEGFAELTADLLGDEMAPTQHGANGNEGSETPSSESPEK